MLDLVHGKLGSLHVASQVISPFVLHRARLDRVFWSMVLGACTIVVLEHCMAFYDMNEVHIWYRMGSLSISG